MMPVILYAAFQSILQMLLNYESNVQPQECLHIPVYHHLLLLISKTYTPLHSPSNSIAVRAAYNIP